MSMYQCTEGQAIFKTAENKCKMQTNMHTLGKRETKANKATMYIRSVLIKPGVLDYNALSGCLVYTVKPVLNGHSKIDKTKSLMQVESIA